MKLDKARRILEAMSAVVSRGEHFEWSGLTHIAKNAGLNRQTTYRYLESMVSQKLVYKVERTWRGEKCCRYYMTQDGRKFLSSFVKLI